MCSNRIIFHLRESILRYAVFCILLLTAQTGWTEYLAYSVTDNSKKPLPENIDGVDAKHLINIEWGAFAGGKSRVAILEVDNTSTADSFVVVAGISAASYGNSQVPVNGIEAIVTDAVSRTGRFRLVERQVLGDRTWQLPGGSPAPPALQQAWFWVHNTWCRWSSPTTRTRSRAPAKDSADC